MFNKDTIIFFLKTVLQIFRRDYPDQLVLPEWHIHLFQAYFPYALTRTSK